MSWMSNFAVLVFVTAAGSGSPNRASGPGCAGFLRRLSKRGFRPEPGAAVRWVALSEFHGFPMSSSSMAWTTLLSACPPGLPGLAKPAVFEPGVMLISGWSRPCHGMVIRVAKLLWI